MVDLIEKEVDKKSKRKSLGKLILLFLLFFKETCPLGRENKFFGIAS